MHRRDFLEQLGAIGIGAVAGGSLSSCANAARPSLPQHWAWVHGGRQRTPSDWRGDFAQLRQAGIRGVLVGGGDPVMLSGAAREEGLQFHRWMWTLNRSGDAWVREHHPEWFTVSRAGKSSLEHPPYVGYYRWLCPTREPVREYLRGKVEEIARDAAVDGVHLDYVRHADVILPRGLWSKYDLVQDREYPEFDFCYCDACREAFREQGGTDPLDLPDPTADTEWRRFRWDSVTGLVRVLAAAAHAHDTPISAAVFPSPTIARRLVRQAWDEWPLDAFFPMLYHRFYEEDIAWIGRTARDGVTALRARAPLYAGLYLPDLPPAELGQAVRVAMGGGTEGVALFEMGGLTPEHLEAMVEEGGTGKGEG